MYIELFDVRAEDDFVEVIISRNVSMDEMVVSDPYSINKY